MRSAFFIASSIGERRCRFARSSSDSFFHWSGEAGRVMLRSIPHG
jgi:hypothetical protein